jgi:hypothetical protein
MHSAPAARSRHVASESDAEPITNPPPWNQTSTGNGPEPFGVTTMHGTPASSRSSTAATSAPSRADSAPSPS